jgi:hypothetical protein
MNLRPGDLIVFDQHDDGSLFLKPAPTETPPSAGSAYLIQAHAFSTPGVLERVIVGAYRAGHDSIELRSELPLAPERVEELLDTVRGLLGVSVVAQEPNRIVLQNFIDPSKYGLPQLVQRLKMIEIATLEEAEEILRRRTRSRRLRSLGDENAKVLALLVRQLFMASRDRSLARRIGCPDPRQLLEWRVVVHALQEISRLIQEISASVDEDPAGIDSGALELAGLLTELKATLRSVVETLIEPTLGGACNAHAESMRLAELARGTARQLKAPARKSGILIATLAVERSAVGLAALTEIAVDRAVSSNHEAILVSSP